MSINPIINKKLLLAADKQEILKLGDLYSKLNNLPKIPQHKMRAYLSGKPIYLGDTENALGMCFEDARRCLYDIVRTQKLIQGIVKQMKRIKLNNNEVFHVIEAGGGTGILAIVAALMGGTVSLLEINPETKHQTELFVKHLGLDKKITVYLADAETYIPKRPIDMIICECLHTGLALEPQIQILHNLGNYLKPDGKVIPEGVNLRWALADIDWSGIEEFHTEKRNLKKKIRTVGKWSINSYVDFINIANKEKIDEIQFMIPMHTLPTNAVMIEMDVLITAGVATPIVLKSGEAEFLGHPHAIRLNRHVTKKQGAYAFGCFPPGKNFPKEVLPLKREADYKVFQKKSKNSFEVLK
jgi:protein-L-isoaspartate O-methyltransferase